MAGHDHDDFDIEDDSDDDVCGPPTESDCVDEELEGIVERLVRSGYDEEDAENAVYTALEMLVESDEGEDTPEMDESIQAKQTWIAKHAPLIRRTLREDLRLTFTEE